MRSKPSFIAVLFVVSTSCNLCQPIATSDSDGGTGTDSDATVDASGDTGTDTCLTESDDEFCRRHGKDCGLLTADDNCGVERRIQCGECDGGTECGEIEPNVCGCPCDVDGECHVSGERREDAPCFVCDPAVSRTAWTLTEGTACDDEDPCSDASFCQPDGTCAPDPTDPGCAVLDGECVVGVCDVEAGECATEMLPDGDACPDDGLTCTTDLCADGTCDHSVIEGFCLDGGRCYADGETHESSLCSYCNGATGTFTLQAPGTPCEDGDGLDCTAGSCDAQGQCSGSALTADSCLIDGSCYVRDEQNPAVPCETCNPTLTTGQWSPATDLEPCKTSACTTGSCAAGICANETIDDGFCRIGDVCYAADAPQPGNDCAVCTPTSLQTDWSNRPNGTDCGSAGNCSCQAGTCRKSNGMVCN